jgi:putative transposase/transposase-like zinc-binding protein
MTHSVCVEATRTGQWTVGAVLRDGASRMAVKSSPHQWKVLRAVQACRTGALGVATYRCKDCHRLHAVAASCGNRHCPECQGRLARQWLVQQQSRLLAAPYFHLVLTLPHALNALIRQNREALYELLFESASQTVLTFGQNHLQAEIGLTMVLHTWGQQLNEHYHVHAIVTGGGLDEQGHWREVAKAYYLFPIKALAVVFRAKFCAGLQHLRQTGQLQYHGEQRVLKQETAFEALVRTATARKWVVYAKKPFAGPETVLRYLSNYTHRVGISSRRILHLDQANHQVQLRYRNYAQGGQGETMQMDTGEFARRFCLHILPSGFCKVRHYGLLGNRGRRQRLEQARAAIAVLAKQHPSQFSPVGPPKPESDELSSAVLRCPYCDSPRQQLVRVTRLPRRAQPGTDSS